MQVPSIRTEHSNQKNLNSKTAVSFEPRATRPITDFDLCVSELAAQSTKLKIQKWKSKKTELVVVKKL
jgi:hypothetical protein